MKPKPIFPCRTCGYDWGYFEDGRIWCGNCDAMIDDNAKWPFNPAHITPKEMEE